MTAISGGGLSFGITPYMLRLLCENPWEGGGGYDPGQLARWTPDQIYFRLANLKVLKAKSQTGNRRTGLKTSTLGVTGKADADGMIKGRDKDGNEIKARIVGKSLTRQLMEAEKAKADGVKESRRGRRQKRRERRKNNGS